MLQIIIPNEKHSLEMVLNENWKHLNKLTIETHGL